MSELEDIGTFLGTVHKGDTNRLVYLEQKVQQLLAFHSGSIPFNPVDLTLGTKTWLDASDSTRVLAGINGRVHTFLDKFGNNHLYQETEEHQPLTGTTTQNGLNTLLFSEPDHMESDTSGIKNENQVWLYVFKPEVVDNGSDSLFTYGDKWRDGNWQLMAGDVAEFHGSLWKDSTPSSADHKFGNVDLNGNWTLFSVEFDRQMGTISGWVNGALAFQNLESAPPLNEFQPIKLFQSRGSEESPSGEVAEVIITPTIEDSSRELLEWYLTDKWDLTPLPSSHPYASTPPAGGSGGGTKTWHNSTESRPRSGEVLFSITTYEQFGTIYGASHPMTGDWFDIGIVKTINQVDYPVYRHVNNNYFLYKTQIVENSMQFSVWVMDTNHEPTPGYLFRSGADVTTNTDPTLASWIGDDVLNFGPGGDTHYTDAQMDLLDFTVDTNGGQMTGTLVSNLANDAWVNNRELYNLGSAETMVGAIGEANGTTKLDLAGGQISTIDRESFTGRGLRVISIEFEDDDGTNTYPAPIQTTRGTLYGVYNHTSNEIYYRALEFPDVYFPLKMTFSGLPLGRQP